MTPLLDIIGMGLAAHYITYVVAESSFPLAQRIRDWAMGRWEPGSWQAYLATCGWCVSAYTSAVVVAGVALVGNVPTPGAAWLATATLSGFLMLVNGLLDRKSLVLLKQLEKAPESKPPIPPKPRRRGGS